MLSFPLQRFLVVPRQLAAPRVTGWDTRRPGPHFPCRQPLLSPCCTVELRDPQQRGHLPSPDQPAPQPCASPDAAHLQDQRPAARHRDHPGHPRQRQLLPQHVALLRQSAGRVSVGSSLPSPPAPWPAPGLLLTSTPPTGPRALPRVPISRSACRKSGAESSSSALADASGLCFGWSRGPPGLGDMVGSRTSPSRSSFSGDSYPQ